MVCYYCLLLLQIRRCVVLVAYFQTEYIVIISYCRTPHSSTTEMMMMLLLLLLIDFRDMRFVSRAYFQTECGNRIDSS